MLPPSPQDAHICRKILDEAQVDSHFCDSLEAFCRALAEGAGTALVAEECLTDEGLEELKQILNSNPRGLNFHC